DGRHHPRRGHPRRRAHRRHLPAHRLRRPAGEPTMTLILVVDDDLPFVRALRINLTARGYQVITAQDGATALLAAATDRPDLVLLDLGLPDIDGIDVIRELRTWSSVPIIVLSARATSTDKIQALDIGADTYITKPF